MKRRNSEIKEDLLEYLNICCALRNLVPFVQFKKRKAAG